MTLNTWKLRKTSELTVRIELTILRVLVLGYWNSNGEQVRISKSTLDFQDCLGDLLEIRPSTSVQTQSCIFKEEEEF